LPARPAAAVGVDPQVLLLDVDLDVLVDLGPGEERGEGSVAPGRRVEGADAHQPVHPHLGGEVAVRVLPPDQQGAALDARFLPGPPAANHSASTRASSSWLRRRFRRATSVSGRLRGCITFWAASWSFQKSAPAIFSSMPRSSAVSLA